MFIRTKTTPRNSNISVQIVESYRERGRTYQRVIRHVGTAKSKKELVRLKNLGVVIKTEIESLNQKKKFIDKEDNYEDNLGKTKTINKNAKLSLAYSKECSRQILGIHDVYGFIYDSIFKGSLLNIHLDTKSEKILKEIVLGRIANPASKRRTVAFLEYQFGKKINLDNVYQMMNKIDDEFCEHIQEQALSATLDLTGENLKVLFYDATTIYFESFKEDDLKQNGYSKDMKFNQPQVLMALFVTEKGLPVGYGLFPGATYEGHTLVSVLEKLKFKYNIKEVVFVADRGMLNKENLNYLSVNKLSYIVGSRIKSSKNDLKEIILDWANNIDKEKVEKEITKEIIINKTERLILSYRKSRARKDEIDREKAILKLQSRLKRSSNPKQLISRYGFQKFIEVKGNARLEIDENKLAEESNWDGIVGLITNNFDLSHQEVLEQYRGLWQVEESFRINKYNLRIRPIYHWTPKRIKAHITISFMAFVCVRYLEYRLNILNKKISIEEIRNNLLQVQASIIEDIKSRKKYLIPSCVNPLTKYVYNLFGLKVPQSVMEFEM